MLHEAPVLAIVKTHGLHISAVTMGLVESVRVTGDAIVHRVAAAMDDPGVREQQGNEAEQKKIMRHLVNDARCCARMAIQFGKVTRGEVPARGVSECRNAPAPLFWRSRRLMQPLDVG